MPGVRLAPTTAMERGWKKDVREVGMAVGRGSTPEPPEPLKSNPNLMPRTTLLRTIRFRAEHRYWRPDWGEERNRQVFGEQAVPHAHDWKVEVAVDGAVDRETGFLVELGALDALLHEVMGTLDGKDLNEAIPEVREGEILPSTEELAGWFWRRLEGRIPGDARLRRVRVAESPHLASEMSVEDGP